MEIRDNENLCIYAPLSPKLNSYESKRLFNELANDSRIVGIDLSYVCDCTIDFIEELKALSKIKNIGIFNIPSDIFTLFNFMNLDKTAELYVSELDFLEGSRKLINRKFAVV